jgi:hypothetical protein
MACALLHNFIVDERTDVENNDLDLLHKYKNDLAEARRATTAADRNLEVEDDEFVLPIAREIGQKRLQQQVNAFLSFNRL